MQGSRNPSIGENKETLEFNDNDSTQNSVADVRYEIGRFRTFVVSVFGIGTEIE